jgi:hypothetical protein
VNTSNNKLLEFKNKIPSIKGRDDWKLNISDTYREIFKEMLLIIEKHENDVFPEQKEILKNIVDQFDEKAKSLINNSPDIYLRALSREALKPRKGDSLGITLYKIRKNIQMGPFRRVKKQKVRFRRLMVSYMEQQFYAELTEVMRNWGMISLQQIVKTQDLINKVFGTYFLLNKLEPDVKAADLIDEKIDTYFKYREQIDKLNESSLQTFYALMMNKTLYLVRQLSKDLAKLRLKAVVKKNQKRSEMLEKDAGILKYSPDRWYSNQKLLNNFTRLELMLFIYISNAKDILYTLHLDLDKLIKASYLDHLQQINSSAGHSSLIFATSIKEAEDGLSTDDFRSAWEELISRAHDELLAYAGEMVDKIQLIDRSVYDNFKESQFREIKPITLRVRRLTEYILKKDFLDPIEEVSQETCKWVEGEIAETKTLIEQSAAAVELIKSDKSRLEDFPQMKQYITAFDLQLREAEKTKLRMLNQLQERINALVDKFSINTITRRTNFLKKFIR